MVCLFETSEERMLGRTLVVQGLSTVTYLQRIHRKDKFIVKCCDRVPQTGELEERDIRLDVQVGQAVQDGHCLEKIDFFYLTSKYKMIIKCSVSF